MFESLLDFIFSHKIWLLYATVIIGFLVIVYIYLNKYMLLARENETSSLKNDFQQLKLEIDRLKTNNHELNTKYNIINTRTKYGEISPSFKPNYTKLPFTFECMEDTPFYNLIGQNVLSNVIRDDELTPTNKQNDEISISSSEHLAEQPNHLVDSPVSVKLQPDKLSTNIRSETDDNNNYKHDLGQIDEDSIRDDDENSLKTDDLILDHNLNNSDRLKNDIQIGSIKNDLKVNEPSIKKKLSLTKKI